MIFKKDPVEAAYQEYSDQIYRFLYWLCGDEPLAEDLTNETFIRAWQHQEIFNGQHNARAWLYRVARNLLTDHWRKKRDSALDEDSEVVYEYDMAAVTDQRMQAEALRKHVAQLTQPSQTIVVLRFFEQLSVREVATILNLTEANVRTLQYRALQTLKKHLSHD